MARSPRIERPGAWHHVTARGNERKAIFRDDADRRHFVQLLGEAVQSYGWRLHAYVLMGNHYHLLVETPTPNLGRGMQWLNVSYSVWFNRRHQRVGHLLQGRFKSIVVDAARWALELSRYVRLNPIRTGRYGLDKGGRRQLRQGLGGEPEPEAVKARIADLRTYRWSSYRAYVGLERPPEWLECRYILQLGGGRPENRPREYRRYVEAAVREGIQESPWENLRSQTVLGGARFARKIAAALAGGQKKSPARRDLARPTVREIIAAVEAVKGEKWEHFRDRRGDIGRETVFYLGREDWKIKHRELGQAAGAEPMAVSMAARRLKRKLEHSAELSSFVEQCRQKLEMFYV